MVSLSNPEKLQEYLISNNLMDIFIFLVGSTDNLRNRGDLLIKDLTDLTKGLQRAIQKVSENPDISPLNKEVSQLFKNLHYMELETIQRISIFIELLAVYYHAMRSDIRDLPRAIAKQDISSATLYSEFENFRNQSILDVRRNFKYPSTDNFDELTPDEKEELEEILDESAKMMLDFFKDIYDFNNHFRPIYTKYKHIMSEVTGVYGIDKVNSNIESQVYMRQKTVDQNNNPHYSVYVIPLSTDIIQHFDKIARSVWTLLMYLCDNHLLSLANEGKDFIPRNPLIHEEAKRQRFLEITKKITSYCTPNLQSVLKVNAPTDAEVKRKINEAFKTDYIYVMNKDILGAEFLKTAEISRTETLQKPEKTQQDFEIVDTVSSSESWSTYGLPDGTILKIRDVLIEAIRLCHFDPQGNPVYNLATHIISTVLPPKSVLGKESPPFTQEELSKSVVDPNVKFDVIQEPWNRYVLSDGTEIETRTVLDRAAKTDKCGHYGEPVYITTRTLNLKVNVADKLRKT